MKWEKKNGVSYRVREEGRRVDKGAHSRVSGEKKLQLGENVLNRRELNTPYHHTALVLVSPQIGLYPVSRDSPII